MSGIRRDEPTEGYYVWKTEGPGKLSSPPKAAINILIKRTEGKKITGGKNIMLLENRKYLSRISLENLLIVPHPSVKCSQSNVNIKSIQSLQGRRPWPQ